VPPTSEENVGEKFWPYNQDGNHAKLLLILSALHRESMDVTSVKTIERMEPSGEKKSAGNNAVCSDGETLDATSFRPCLLLKSSCRIHEALATCQKALIQTNGII
jgi:hypothetical protein